VELLLAGAFVDDVATIPGNTPNVVLRHSVPWVREGQVRLKAKLKNSDEAHVGSFNEVTKRDTI
jgi:hypothetical protein